MGDTANRTAPGEPARRALEQLLARASSSTLEAFVAEVRTPYLVKLGSADDASQQRARSSVQTVHGSHLPVRRNGRPFQAYPIAKRAGSNAFAFMITLGRTPNNDITIEEEPVSKFHASFANATGCWTITDTSRHGTWVDGQPLVPKQATPLRSGASLVLAEAVAFRFYLPEDLYGYLKTVAALP